MKKYLVLAALCVSSWMKAQDRTELWLGAGLKREVAPNFVASAGTNLRTRTDGVLQTLFQDVGIKSEHLDWFRPSIELRFITSYDKARNYSNAFRLNFNFDFRHKIEQTRVGFRFRYQTGLGNVASAAGDLDRSLRFRPYVSYEIKDTRFTINLSAEWFYNPQNGENGDRFNRFRSGLGTDIDIPGPNTLSLTYFYGRKFNSGRPYNEHLFSLEYGFEWKNKKKK